MTVRMVRQEGKAARAAIATDAEEAAAGSALGAPGTLFRAATDDQARRNEDRAAATGLARIFGDAQTLPMFAAGAEFAILAFVTYEAGALYHEIAFGRLPFATFYALATLCLAALFVIPCGLRREYSLKRLLDPREQLRAVFFRWNSAYALFVFALFMVHATDFYSRGSILVQYAAGLAAAGISRLVLARIVAGALRDGRIKGRKVVVVGGADQIAETVKRLRLDGQGANVIEVVALTSPSIVPPQNNGGFLGPATSETRAAIAAVRELNRSQPIDEVVLALPWRDGPRIRAIVNGLAAVPATIHLAPDDTMPWTRDLIPARIGLMRTARLARTPLTLKDRILKRAFDLATASALLVLSAPLLAVIALLIKLDSPGPALFRQRRHGFNHSEFRVLKFRTMRTLDDGSVIPQVRRGDARVTRIGRFLRRTNLDELPQLLNVIAGHMSLVGPRPHAVAHNNEYEEKIRLYARRHNVKPGITGWAQVNGYRGETNSIEKMRRRVESDLFYIDHWSLAFDIRIIVMTILSPRSYRNAY